MAPRRPGPARVCVRHGLLGLVAALAVTSGCGWLRDQPNEPGGDGSVPLATGEPGAHRHADGVTVDGEGRDPTEAGWVDRRVADHPVWLAGDDSEPLTVELGGLEPDRSYDVFVGYVVGLAGDGEGDWGIRARLPAGDGDFSRLDQRNWSHQPDPDNPWIVEARAARMPPGDASLDVEVEALDAGATAFAYARALPSEVADEVTTRPQAGLWTEGPPDVPRAGTGEFPSADDYMLMLQRWPAYAEDGFTDGYEGHDDLGYFGDGNSNEQGMRTLGNFIYAYGLLATDDRYDPSVSGMAPEELETRARKALRYMARTHETGDLPATDDEPWGHHWQSSWWTSRMAAGAFLLWERLDNDERAMVERVVTAEAGDLLDRDPPSAAADDSKAEENAWDTETVAWAIALFPDHRDADDWRLALDLWAMNALSVAADADDDSVVEGRPVREWNSTTNVNADFTIENHGAYHAGYMAWPLQSLAWSAYALAAAGEPVPQTLLHNYREVWQRLGSTYLGNGKFAYAGGKDWPQYVYGLYAVVPPTVLLQQLDGDRLARTVEADRVRTFEWEQRLWGDGGFFSGRFSGHEFRGWQAEFESDAAAILAMAYHLTDVLEDDPDGLDAHDSDRPEPLGDEELGEHVAGAFYSTDSEFAVGQDAELFTLFSWQTLDCCFGSVNEDNDVLGVVSPADPHMVSWQEGQLAGDFSLAESGDESRGVRWQDGEELPGGGYATLGVRWWGGTEDAPLIEQQLAMLSLPQLNRALVIDQPVASEPVELESSSALDVHIPNDVFNQLERRIVSGDRHLTVPAGLADRQVELPAAWVNVDDALGIAYDGSQGALELRTRTDRNLPWDGLRSDTLSWRPAVEEPYRRGEPIRRLAFAFHAGGPGETQRLSERMGLLETDGPELAAAWVQAGDGAEASTVLMAVNFSDGQRQVVLDVEQLPRAGRSELTVDLPGRSLEVVRL